MAKWSFARAAYPGGRFQLVFARAGRFGASRDVTYFRGVETQIGSFADGDPFGDSTAQLTFPSITPFDDLHSGEFRAWLGYYADVDIYWVPVQPAGGAYLDDPLVIDALSNRAADVAPAYRYAGPGPRPRNRRRVFEGFVASLDWSAEDTSVNLQVTLQGALFQVDRYLAKPFYPPQPWPLELLIRDEFAHERRPHLRTAPLRTIFPVNWGLKTPKYSRTLGSTTFTPVGKPGSLWSGYASRQTGAWEHSLTGFVQDQLTVMITDPRSHVTQGNQWTVRHFRLGDMLPRGLDRLGRVHESTPSNGRLPVLMVRDRYRAPDFTLRVGLPGVKIRLTGDSTQSENIIYGEGTGLDGTTWRNSVELDNGRRTDYLPLAADRAVWPLTHNPALRPGAFVSEAFTKFGNGFDQDDAARVAGQQLQRDRDPGWTGTITLETDPSASLPKWCIHAGMTVLLKGFAGSGERGLPLHISATSKNVADGSVELTVDSRYRDLLTVDEARERTRDPLTPVKMLQVNRTSVTVEDIQAPWNYRRSGMVPREAGQFYDNMPRSQLFPYTAWTRQHPPRTHPHWYVKCRANAHSSLDRWAGPVAILTSEKGTINRSQFAVYDFAGNVLKIPFHVSIYYNNTVTGRAMPHDKGQYSPYLDNAFEKVNPRTGQQNAINLGPDDSLIIGWGNKSAGTLNRAGFSPGRESDGAHPTGLLVDEYAFTYDNTNNANYLKNTKPGQKQRTSALMLYAMFYCEHPAPVYFAGRLFRQSPGTD